MEAALSWEALTGREVSVASDRLFIRKDNFRSWLETGPLGGGDTG